MNTKQMGWAALAIVLMLGFILFAKHGNDVPAFFCLLPGAFSIFFAIRAADPDNTDGPFAAHRPH